MNAELWNKLKSTPRGFAYWALILVALVAAIIFLVTSHDSYQKAERVEATSTADRVQSATATAEPRSQAATATAEALTPRAGD